MSDGRDSKNPGGTAARRYSTVAGHPPRLTRKESPWGRRSMVDEGWADTPEGVRAVEWVENYVYGLLKALDDGGLIEARNITAPGFVAQGLQGLGVSDSVMQRTTDLARQAHGCLNSRPADDSGAWNAVHEIGRLWGVH